MYLGPKGPDSAYAQNAVIHWFHEQRLLDPELERWRSKSEHSRISTNTEIGANGIQGWLQITKVTPFDSGNYTCVPSYAIPAWIQILVLPGKILNQSRLKSGKNLPKIWEIIFHKKKVCKKGNLTRQCIVCLKRFLKIS